MQTAQDPASDNEPSETKTEAKAEPVILLPVRHGDAPRSASRRFGLIAASIALAAGLGGVAGAAGFAAVSKLTANQKTAAAPADPTAALQDLRNQLSLMRASIKTMSESIASPPPQRPATDKALTAQVGKLAEAVEKLERSSAEPNGRIAKLTEAVERLEKKVAAATAQPQAQQAAAAAPATTGSVKPPVHPQHTVQSQVVSGWRVHEVYNGVAVIEGQYGLMEVQPGDDVRGLGRVQTIRRQQDGRWAVMTSRGMIVSSR